MTGCPDCRKGIEHCHGTVIVHRDGGSRCSDTAQCSFDDDAHTLAVSCAELVPECRCA